MEGTFDLAIIVNMKIIQKRVVSILILTMMKHFLTSLETTLVDKGNLTCEGEKSSEAHKEETCKGNEDDEDKGNNKEVPQQPPPSFEMGGSSSLA